MNGFEIYKSTQDEDFRVKVDDSFTQDGLEALTLALVELCFGVADIRSQDSE